MTKYQFRVLVALIVILIVLALAPVLPPDGWVALGLLLTCAAIYWLGGVLAKAVDRVWGGR